MTMSKLTAAIAGIGVTFASSFALAATPPANIKTMHTKLGTVYATSQGMTVYEFKQDNPKTQISACYGNCAVLWPPVVAPAGFVPTKPWGVTTRKDGSRELTYEGYPLYTWIKDTKPGEVTGQGVKGVWRVARPGTAQVSWKSAP
ncbi:MAG TPA: hypothetical protein VL356_09500 [Acidocella sp.]|jgi:predicted lipoprotein with Yx(FWY)xxD motif|nr:hypothetical protein [Acidocella sp.]